MIQKFYFDMDGVLVDQDAYLADLAQMDKQTYQTYVKSLDKPCEKNSFVMGLIDRGVAEEGFIKAPPMQYLDMLKVFINTRLDFGIPVEILSSSMQNPNTFEEVCRQKTVWLENNGLGHLKTNFTRGSYLKHEYAKPFHVLVDDYDRNITQWKDKGGIAIHHTSLIPTLEQLSNLW